MPLLNVDDLTSGAANQGRFGEPILMDLGGDSIREIRKNGRDEYLILSAPTSQAIPTSRPSRRCGRGTASRTRSRAS